MMYKYQLFYYSCRSASIGRSFDALEAGKIPKNTPIQATDTKAIITELLVIIAVMNWLIKYTIKKLHPIPINHAKILIIIDSTKNCIRISCVVAHIAFRIPISLVRSVTETSIMFITPIPQTNRDMAAIPQRNIDIVALTDSRLETTSLRELMVNFSTLASVTLRYRLSSVVMKLFIFAI